MLTEFLLILLIIIVVIFFLIFFKRWNIHITFKNDEENYYFFFKINIFFINIVIMLVDNQIQFLLQFSISSKVYDLVKFNLNDKKIDESEEDDSEEDNSEEDESEEDDSEKEDSDDEENNNVKTSDILPKIKEIYPLLYESKEDLFHIVKLIIKMVKFDESYAIINLGLSDNNLTIKFCSLLWALSAPLYPLRFRLHLTPEINKLMIKTEVNIKFNIRLLNILKIIIFIIRKRNLINIIKISLK